MTYETKNVDCLLSLLASLIYHFLLLLQVGFLPAGGPRKQLASPKRLQTSWFIMLGKLLYRSFGFFAAKYGQAALSPSDPWLMHKPRQSLTASCWLLVPLAWDANKLQFELGVPFSWCRGTELPSRIPLHSASYHQLNQPNKVYDKTRWNNTPNVILIGRRFLEHSLSLFFCGVYSQHTKSCYSPSVWCSAWIDFSLAAASCASMALSRASWVWISRSLILACSSKSSFLGEAGQGKARPKSQQRKTYTNVWRSNSLHRLRCLWDLYWQTPPKEKLYSQLMHLSLNGWCRWGSFASCLATHRSQKHHAVRPHIASAAQNPWPSFAEGGHPPWAPRKLFAWR